MVIGYWSTPIHTRLLSWQLLQLPVTPAWIMAAVGAGSLKPVPGALRVATPGTRAEGVLPAWQLSQVVEVGRCELAPGVVLGGITTGQDLEVPRALQISIAKLPHGSSITSSPQGTGAYALVEQTPSSSSVIVMPHTSVPVIARAASGAAYFSTSNRDL